MYGETIESQSLGASEYSSHRSSGHLEHGAELELTGLHPGQGRRSS